jgi:hypothetical protein
MNQKADPNRKTDEEAVYKIITSLTTNGLITQLRLEGNTFETLPTAFFPKITEIRVYGFTTYGLWFHHTKIAKNMKKKF